MRYDSGYQITLKTNLMERVRRQTTTLIFTLHNLSYEERLKLVDMFPLHKRIIRGDMIEFVKIVNKFAKINPEVFFEMNNASVTNNGTK